MSKHEVLMTSAGALLLISLPWFTGFGFQIWLLAKLFYLLGVVFMFMRREKTIK